MSGDPIDQREDRCMDRKPFRDMNQAQINGTSLDGGGGHLGQHG